MDDIEFVCLSEIAEHQIISLMNDPRVIRYLPLRGESFTSDDCRKFVQTKLQMWDDHGFGPWAFRVKGVFAGWGGLQPERGEADFALVLHPDFWGIGRAVFCKTLNWARRQDGMLPIAILLPPDRPNIKAVERFGFVHDGRVYIQGKSFEKYSLPIK